VYAFDDHRSALARESVGHRDSGCTDGIALSIEACVWID